jgi:excisionase family DNA binding protein
MPPKTRTAQARETSANKANNTGNSSIMEDAPLFAGLDDFVLKQSERKRAAIPQAGKEKKKKTTEKKPAKQAKAAGSKSQPARKVPKTVSIDPDAVLLSVAETCALLKISRATLIRMDNAGKLPGRIKLGGSVRFHHETIVTWLQSLITHPTT